MSSGARRIRAVTAFVGACAAFVVGPTRAPAAPTKAAAHPRALPAKSGSKPATAPPPTAPPVGLLPFLPSIARVAITSHGKVVSVVCDVSLPRGAWKGDSLRFHVAFGAPGPRAVDAHLVPVGDGEVEADAEEAGEILATERVAGRPPNAYPLLGRDVMAGVVVQVPAPSLAKAFARGNMTSLRIRSLVDVTEPDATGASSLVVRLGASRGTPLTLGRITATSAPSAPPLTRIDARLCGPEADSQPLAVTLLPRQPRDRTVATIAPVLAVRHASDDLCVRFWQPARSPTP